MIHIFSALLALLMWAEADSNPRVLTCQIRFDKDNAVDYQLFKNGEAELRLRYKANSYRCPLNFQRFVDQRNGRFRNRRFEAFHQRKGCSRPLSQELDLGVLTRPSLSGKRDEAKKLILTARIFENSPPMKCQSQWIDQEGLSYLTKLKPQPAVASDPKRKPKTLKMLVQKVLPK
ncbi:MAG: hypothetical protein AAF202_13170 [Pseudomonadota bacterium]